MNVSVKKNGERKWKNYDHVMRAPTSMGFSGVKRMHLSSCSAQRSIPSDFSPEKVAGFKLVSTIMSFPTNSSAV